MSTRTLGSLERGGFRVHRIGAAAYVHGAGHHLILAVWDRGDPIPAFAARLGRASEGYRRRIERIARETRHAELLRIRGRFAGRLPWWRMPAVRAYAWDPAPVSWIERERARAAAHNHAVLVRRGILREVGR